MSICGGGGGIIPASRFLRRRAAVRDLGRDADADDFCVAAPLLYDFSQQQPQLEEQVPPAVAARRSPPPAPKPRSPPAPVALERPRSPRPPPSPAARRSPSPEPCSPCLLDLEPPSPPAARRSPSSGGTGLLLALQRTCVGWGATRRVEYPSRHRHASPAAPGAGTAAVEGTGRRGVPARRGDEDQESISGGGANRRKRLEGVAAAEESGREDKPLVAKAGKSRSRNMRKAGQAGGHAAGGRCGCLILGAAAWVEAR